MKALKYEIVSQNLWILTGAIAIGLVVIFGVIGIIMLVPLYALHTHIKNTLDEKVYKIRTREWKHGPKNTT